MRTLAFRLKRSEADEEDFPPLSEGGSHPKQPWISRWEHRTDREVVHIAVRIHYDDGRVELTDARDLIERLHNLPRAIAIKLYVRVKNRPLEG